jgi:type II secretory pathway pseudopilin PulG
MAPDLLTHHSTVRHHRKTRPRAGFTLAEAVIVMATVAIVVTIGVPALQQTMQRSKVSSTVREAELVLRQARGEAVRRGVPAVVGIDPVESEVVAFVDVNGVALTDPPDCVFTPDAGAAERNTDYEIARYPLPEGLEFLDPDGNSGRPSLDGLLTTECLWITCVGTAGDPLAEERVIFNSDGSVCDSGAIRLADQRENYFEIRLATRATGRVEVRKYNAALPANEDGEHWYSSGEGGKAWVWN